MRKDKKGISPLIATVLLIGFAVALAAVVMTWGLDFVKDTADATSTQTQSTLICASDLIFAISDVTIDESGTAIDSSITIDNRGQVDINSILFRIYRGDGVVDVVTSAPDEAGVEALNNVGIPKFAVIEFKDSTGTTSLHDALFDSGGKATKVEAVAIVPGVTGSDEIICSQNIQEYTI